MHDLRRVHHAGAFAHLIKLGEARKHQAPLFHSSVYQRRLNFSSGAPGSATSSRQGLDVTVIDIPGEDETVVIAAGLSVDQTGDFADEVRRRVKRVLRDIPYYAKAVELLARRMQSPAALDEEQDGIGTVSAGVAADRGLPELLFSDISAAVKESKTCGRNKTVICRPGQPSEIRSDFLRACGREERDNVGEVDRWQH